MVNDWFVSIFNLDTTFSHFECMCEGHCERDRACSVLKVVSTFSFAHLVGCVCCHSLLLLLLYHHCHIPQNELFLVEFAASNLVHKQRPSFQILLKLSSLVSGFILEIWVCGIFMRVRPVMCLGHNAGYAPWFTFCWKKVSFHELLVL